MRCDGRTHFPDEDAIDPGAQTDAAAGDSRAGRMELTVVTKMAEEDDQDADIEQIEAPGFLSPIIKPLPTTARGLSLQESEPFEADQTSVLRIRALTRSITTTVTTTTMI